MCKENNMIDVIKGKCFKIDGDEIQLNILKEVLKESKINYKQYDSAQEAFIEEEAYGTLENEYNELPDLNTRDESKEEFISNNISEVTKDLNENIYDIIDLNLINGYTDDILREKGYFDKEDYELEDDDDEDIIG